MNEKKLKQLNIISILALFLGIAFILVFVLVFSPKDQKKIAGKNVEFFNEGWVLKNFKGNSDQIVSLPLKLDVDVDEILVLTHQIPDDVNVYSVLAFKSQFQNIRVMIGNETVYSNGILNDQKRMKNSAPCYNIVSLATASPKDVVTIYISSSYKKYCGVVDDMFYGTEGDVVVNLIKSNGISFGLSVVLLAVAILLTVSLLLMKNAEVDKRKSAYGFGFVFIAAAWSILSNPLMQILTDNTFGVYMASMVLLMLLPVIYIMYQRCFVQKKRYAFIFEVGYYVFAINFLIGSIFQLLNVIDFSYYVIFTKALIVIGLVILSGLMYLAADTYSDKSIYNNFYANSILALSLIVEFVLSFFDFYKDKDGMVLQIGIFIFLILLVVAIQKDIIKEVNTKKDEAIKSLEVKKETLASNINTKLVYKSMNEAITTLKMMNDKDNSRLIYDTSIYLKNNIRATTKVELVPFEEELAYIKAYLGMQKRIKPELDITIEDKVDNFLIPFSTIELLVENAVNNGALKAAANPHIVVRIYERLDCFAIQIVDNGKGIGPDKAFYGNNTYKDIKKKLKVLCSAAIEIKNKSDKGTIVTVKIPKKGFIIKE